MKAELPVVGEKRICGTCRWWAVGEFEGCAEYDHYDHSDFGECKRYPRVEEKFSIDFCGEWAAIPAPAGG